jgi:hypothetical protein
VCNAAQTDLGKDITEVIRVHNEFRSERFALKLQERKSPPAYFILGHIAPDAAAELGANGLTLDGDLHALEFSR